MDAARIAGELIPRLRRWPAASWTVRPEPSPAGSGTRAEVTAATVQRLADLGADLEGRPHRPVPRLADTSLADQLAVMVGDELATGDPTAALLTATSEDTP